VGKGATTQRQGEREKAIPLLRVGAPLLGINALKESAPLLKREDAPLLEISINLTQLSLHSLLTCHKGY